MATTTTRKRAQPRKPDGEFAAKSETGTTTARRASGTGTRGRPRKKQSKGLFGGLDLSARNLVLGTAAMAGAGIAGALFAAWRSQVDADVAAPDASDELVVRTARDVIDDEDRDQFAPATIPLRDSKYDRELA